MSKDESKIIVDETHDEQKTDFEIINDKLEDIKNSIKNIDGVNASIIDEIEEIKSQVKATSEWVKDMANTIVNKPIQMNSSEISREVFESVFAEALNEKCPSSETNGNSSATTKTAEQTHRVEYTNNPQINNGERRNPTVVNPRPVVSFQDIIDSERQFKLEFQPEDKSILIRDIIENSVIRLEPHSQGKTILTERMRIERRTLESFNDSEIYELAKLIAINESNGINMRYGPHQNRATNNNGTIKPVSTGWI